MVVRDAVIPVGGLATRLLPLTRAQPKEMLPIVDRPVVEYVVEELMRAGIARILFVTSRRKHAIEDHFDAQPELGLGPLVDPRSEVELLYTRQARPAGLGDALIYAESLARQGGVVVALGDAIIETPASPAPGIVPRLIEAYQRGGAAATLAVSQVDDRDVARYGIAVGEADGREPFSLHSVIEKPDPATVRSRTAIMGRYVLGPPVFEALRDTAPDSNGEVQLAAALQKVIDSGDRVVAVPLGPGERRHDVGSVEGYCATFLRYALADPRFGARLRAGLNES